MVDADGIVSVSVSGFNSVSAAARILLRSLSETVCSPSLDCCMRTEALRATYRRDCDVGHERVRFLHNTKDEERDGVTKAMVVDKACSTNCCSIQRELFNAQREEGKTRRTKLCRNRYCDCFAYEDERVR